MCTSDLLNKLRAEGFEVQSWHIGYAVKCGYVPTPPRNGALQFVWGPEHLKALRKYLATSRATEAAA